MAGADSVLAIPTTTIVLIIVVRLVYRFAAPLLSVAATFVLARRNGQAVKSTSWSHHHGYSAEFFESKDSERAQPE